MNPTPAVPDNKISTKEPIVFTEAIRALILAIVPFVKAFGIWDPSKDQIVAMLGLIVPASIILSIFARLRSTPTNQVAMTQNERQIIEATIRDTTPPQN